MILRSCLTCISLCAIFLTEAQTRADSLYAAGRYFEASIAWERILFENDNKEQQLTAVLGKTECLKQQGFFDQAVTFLEGWQSYPFPDSGQLRIQYQHILCTYLGGHFENVLSLAGRWPYEHAGRPLPSFLEVLKILSLNELQRWNEAGDAYRAFMATRRGTDTLSNPYNQLPHLKSVARAQWLSTFIPGGGQFYAGRPGEAIFSILVQAAGVYIAVASFQQHYYVTAWLVGAALFGAFHMGGVRRAEVLVQRYNRKKTLAFNARVKEQLLQVISTEKAAP